MNNGENIVRTRMAPSPTGVLHIGTLRVALYNYVFAKQHGGEFIVRFEDTDKERSKPEYEENILEGLTLAGLVADEVSRQSDRVDIHRSYLAKLIEDGYAYVSKEEEGERDEVIRFKNPNKIVSFDDVIRGAVEVDTTDLGDFVIAKSLTEPLFHIAVVVDDFEMGITHIIRGEDHISNTPRHILLQEAIGAPRPIYAHLPLVLAPDRSKLSKRHGAVSVSEYLKDGYLVEALLNFLALLGWSPQSVKGADASDIFSLDELIKLFDLTKVQKGGAVFVIEKLRDINKHYIGQLSDDVLLEKIRHWLPGQFDASDELLRALTPVILERIDTFGDLRTMTEEGELDCFFSTPAYDGVLLLGKKGDLDKDATKEHLLTLSGLLDSLPHDTFTADTVKDAIWEYATEQGRGAVLWPLRTCLTGAERSPDPFTVAGILGKQETLARISHAVELLS